MQHQQQALARNVVWGTRMEDEIGSERGIPSPVEWGMGRGLCHYRDWTELK